MTAFAMLSPQGLESLADALENGRVTAPSTMQLRGMVGEAAESASAELMALIERAFSTSQIALLLRILADERRRAASAKTELVWTGPETAPLPSRDTGVVVRELFTTAERSVLIVGFAIHRGREVFRELADRMRHVPLDVMMILNIARGPGDTTRSEHLVARFAQTFRREHWPGEPLPDVYYDPRSLEIGGRTRTSLHAKCVVVDERLSLVTSANFTEAAQERNIEVGALVHDPSFALSLTARFRMLIKAGALVKLPTG